MLSWRPLKRLISGNLIKCFYQTSFFSQELDVYVSHKAAYFVQCKTGVCSPRWP